MSPNHRVNHKSKNPACSTTICSALEEKRRTRELLTARTSSTTTRGIMMMLLGRYRFGIVLFLFHGLSFETRHAAIYLLLLPV